MKITINSVWKTYIRQYFMLLIFLCTTQIAFGDDVQKAIDTNFLRSPEASAFKKYGEESVNEYTGTADISVPLYTIKSKDIEIPLVLRYDASGIKVEQEASWVGLGWNLMVGGCINYVCAGGHDMYKYREYIDTKLWTEYLTSEFTSWVIGDSIIEYDYHPNIFTHTKLNQVDIWATRNRTMYYTYASEEKNNWMNTLPLDSNNFVNSYIDIFSNSDMKDYIDGGYGERDFYSVNVMGKSFLFFIDPATLKVFRIGKDGEDFRVTPIYGNGVTPIYGNGVPPKGIGKQPSVEKWKITDSDGFIYEFDVKDTYQQEKNSLGVYTSCWYLTKIQSPNMGVYAEFEYEPFSKKARKTYAESCSLPFIHDLGAFCCGDAADNIRTSREPATQSENYGMNVTSHYLKKIKTNNQTVTFIMKASDECSGMQLDKIEVQPYEGKPIKTVMFNYGKFSSSNIGGNYAPNDVSISSPDRLKLESVNDFNSESGSVLTTSFSYNESIKLPSKRSYAQDYWGYYNGKDNKIGDKYTMIPTPQAFMSSHYDEKIDTYTGVGGADRFSDGDFMQAAMLEKVIYPTRGYTIYEYEPNSIMTDFNQTEKYRKKQYEVNVQAIYKCYPGLYGQEEKTTSVWQQFEIDNESTCDLLLSSYGYTSQYNNKSVKIEIRKWNDTTHNYELITEYKEPFKNRDDFPAVKNIDLSAGKYYMAIDFSNNKKLTMGITCSLSGWKKSTIENPNHPLAVGGLRVKKICNYDNDGKPINFTTYDYSGGILLDKIETIDSVRNYNANPKPGDYSIANISHSIDVYTITQGHSRMPAFFASCNPGIVGYSYVTKNKYNMNGDLEKSIITSYKNDEPVYKDGIDYYENFGNGQINWQEIRDASNNLVAKNQYDYALGIVDHYATNIIAKNKYVGQEKGGSSIPYYEVRDKQGTKETVTLYALPGAYDILRYQYILSRDSLSSMKTTEYCSDGSILVTTKKYCYNPKNHQVSQIDEFRSNSVENVQKGASLTNQLQRTKLIYAVDETDIDLNCKNMVNSHHRLNDVVETKNILVDNGTESCMNTVRIAYNNAGFPISSSTSIGANQPEVRSIYTYDGDSNVRSISLDGKETIYIWSYNGQYPIAKIEGITYEEVEDAVGKTNISSLLRKTTPTTSDINTIRTNIKAKGGYVTTYTYKPLVGMTSQTLPNGLTTKYEYDGFGRLVKIIDHNGKTVATNSYHYKK